MCMCEENGNGDAVRGECVRRSTGAESGSLMVEKKSIE